MSPDTPLRAPTAARASYGVDAPGALTGLICGAVIAAVVTIVVAVLAGHWYAWIVPLLMAVYCAASAACYAHTTLRGKFRVWAERLGGLGLAGDERALDLGCGRGAVLIQAARLLPRGHVTGVDLWSTKDQSGNAEDRARRNTEAEGVSSRVDLVTGDMRDLPFDDASFDLVVSSLAVHNVPDETGRAQAIGEAYRVLAPGGRLLIADFQHTPAYAATLRDQGAHDVAVTDLGPRFWYGAPWFATHLVTATKPA